MNSPHSSQSTVASYVSETDEEIDADDDANNFFGATKNHAHTSEEVNFATNFSDKSMVSPFLNQEIDDFFKCPSRDLLYSPSHWKNDSGIGTTTGSFFNASSSRREQSFNTTDDTLHFFDDEPIRVDTMERSITDQSFMDMDYKYDKDLTVEMEKPPTLNSVTPADLHSTEVKLNTFYEAPVSDVEFVRLEKRLRSINMEEEVAKILKDPDSCPVFDEIFQYLRWKMVKAGFLKPRLLTLGKKEDVFLESEISGGCEENVEMEISQKTMASEMQLDADPERMTIDVKDEDQTLPVFVQKTLTHDSGIALSKTLVSSQPSQTMGSVPHPSLAFTLAPGSSQSQFNPAQHLSQSKQLKRPLLLPNLNSSSSHLSQQQNSQLPPSSSQTPLSQSQSKTTVLSKRSTELTEKIEHEIQQMLESLAVGQAPSLRVKTRTSWANCFLSQENKMTLKAKEDAQHKIISFGSKKSENYFGLIIFLLGEIYNILVTGSTCTKRELYYRDRELTENQLQTNLALNDISCLLDVPLWELGVLTSSKGLVAGDLLIFNPEGGSTDCQKGVLVPIDVSGIRDFQSNAKYILIVEKDTVFKKLLDDNIFGRLGENIILITGKGYPDVNTRHLIKRLVEKFSIPAYILVDADPHGIEIMFTYRFGSLTLSHEADYLAIPSLKWIGIKPSDIDTFDLSSQALTDDDIKKVEMLLERPYVCEKIQKELKFLLNEKKKAEIEALYLFSSSYLIDQYLTTMINMSCLDDLI